MLDIKLELVTRQTPVFIYFSDGCICVFVCLCGCSVPELGYLSLAPLKSTV